MTDKTVCFSGHRPEKLPGRGNDENAETRYIKELLNSKIEKCISEGYTHFISGTARGIDLWAASMVLEHREKNPRIKLICVKPIENQGFNFPEQDKLLYDEIIRSADSVICTSENYTKNCYMIRNRYMVDNSDLVIAFVKNYRSGTGQTINYASSVGKATDITDLSDIEFDMHYEQLSF